VSIEGRNTQFFLGNHFSNDIYLLHISKLRFSVVFYIKIYETNKKIHQGKVKRVSLANDRGKYKNVNPSPNSSVEKFIETLVDHFLKTHIKE